MKTDLYSPIQYARGVGPERARRLTRLGINFIYDLLNHVPKRYEDRSHLKKLAELTPAAVETVQGKVTGVEEFKPRQGLTIIKALLSDDTGTVQAIWFNQTYLKKMLRQGTSLIVTGKVERRFFINEIAVTDYEIIDGNEALNTGRIVPVYPATEGVSQRLLRTMIMFTLENYASAVTEVLPETIRYKYEFIPAVEAYRQIHFPENNEQLQRARRRLVFEELFLWQLALAMAKQKLGGTLPGVAHLPLDSLSSRFVDLLPYSLTGAQKRVIDEIRADMIVPRAMSRLLQGDVGSGKTLVAALAMLLALENGYQAALMAPTEILAEQHYLNLTEMLAPLGLEVVLLTGSLSRAAREPVLEKINNRKSMIVVGTHALIQEGVNFKQLSLAVIDEQHRFGVNQRAALLAKGLNPDLLVMTATPIPRTLALTVYGDYDLSVLDEMPPGRRPVKTVWATENRRMGLYDFIRQQVTAGRQAYIVCPLIEESEVLDVEAATKLYETLQITDFTGIPLGLLHGRLAAEAKAKVMAAFRAGAIKILVTTSVIEVGVDVPNATIMVIEDAHRFGLAQLHQLRGRVGRGSHQSYCVLMGQPASEEGQLRLKVMEQYSDGFKIAEEDLKLRGPGEFFGTRQHGLPELKIADLLRDADSAAVARHEAGRLLQQDPDLKNPELTTLIKVVNFRYGAQYLKI